jgi:hypothetical protein
MKYWVQRSLAVAGLLFIATSASAFPLRSPQVVFTGGPLQGFLNVVDNGINVATDQLDAPAWAVSITGNTDFTLVLKGGLGQGNAVGVYNAGVVGPPPLFQVFPPFAAPGWFATLHFGGGNLVVTLFDQNSLIMGQSFYPGVNPNNFGFYTLGPCGLWYSQDYRNPAPQMLAYASNTLPGDYWLCWSACPSNPGSTFDDIVLNVQSVRPTPGISTTWGLLKAQYR